MKIIKAVTMHPIKIKIKIPSFIVQLRQSQTCGARLNKKITPNSAGRLLIKIEIAIIYLIKCFASSVEVEPKKNLQQQQKTKHTYPLVKVTFTLNIFISG